MPSLSLLSFVAIGLSLWCAFARAEVPGGSPAVQAAARQHLEAMETGDLDAIVKTLHPVNADEAVLIRIAAEYAKAVNQFTRARVDAFGSAGDHAWPAGGKIEPALREATITIKGDAASVSFNKMQSLQLRQTATGWRVTVGDLLHRGPVVPADEPLRRYSEMTQTFNALTDEIKAGRFKSADEATTAMTQRVTDAANGRNAQ